MEKFNNTKFIANDFETIKKMQCLKLKKMAQELLVVVNTNKQLLGTLSEGHSKGFNKKC